MANRTAPPIGLSVELHALARARSRSGIPRLQIGARFYRRPTGELKARAEQLGRLRAEGHCAVLTSARVREPLSWFTSLYMWTVSGMPFEVTRPCSARPGAAGCSATDLFEKFVRAAPNMQTSMFLQLHAASAWAKCGPRTGCLWSDNAAATVPPAPLGSDDLAAAMQQLDGADVVGVTSEMDRFMALLWHRTGWPSVHYARWVPQPHGEILRRRCAAVGQASASPSGVCRSLALFPNTSSARPCATAEEARRCAAVVSEHAPLDAALFAHAQRRAAQLSAGLGPELERRVRLLRAGRQSAGGMAWQGSGALPRAVCEAVRVGAKGLARLQLLQQAAGVGGGPCAPVPPALAEAISLRDGVSEPREVLWPCEP
ncbi:hypothetical protein T492DRAFT_331235 [Pavlovales sp. CCMP2436]|nr:hypothetical protein T492DRAFT_331235 [Pavlovales sp. CCMP2436]